MLKRLYHLLALLAMINLFSLIGLVGYLFATSRLNRERVQQVAKVLRGAWPAEAQVAATQPAGGEDSPVGSAAEIARTQEKTRFYELLAERHQREMEDRRQLNLEIKLGVDRKLEELEAREKRLQAEQTALKKEGELEGFDKQLEFLSRTDAKKAKDLMKGQMKEADVIHLLMKMDPNRVSKIVNACKAEDEIIWIGRILNQIGKLRAETAAGVDGPSPKPAG